MLRSELYRRYAALERDFSGVDLSSADLLIAEVEEYDPTQNVLSGINLSGANLTQSILSLVNLTGANLSGANLTQADLGGCDLSNANLRGANLEMADFTAVNLINADLRETRMLLTRFDRADLTRANLSSALFQGVSGDDGTLFCNTIMPDGAIINDISIWVDSR
ncbi:MAG: pentapeptide repeat-containing protein [Nostoc sp.]|uniref:pentapeptide repeat-containing protein n=1 Tax=Nostoc sp. TaxID=1180 RepID=UPI002FFC54E3